MNTGQTLVLAMRTLWRNRLRSLLMMLGVTVGIASLTAMASVGEATRQETMRQFQRMVGAFDVLSISPGAARTRGMPSLTTVEPSLKFEDAKAIAQEARTIASVAEVQNAFDIDVKQRDRTVTAAIYGVSANWMSIRGYEVAFGNEIGEDDVRSLARIAIIGEDVRAGLFPDEDPLDKTLRIADVPFQVKGVLESRGAGPAGSSLDALVLIPVTTASKRLFNRDYLTTIAAKLRDPERPEDAIEEVSAILRERHGIVPPGEDDFTVTNPRASMEQVADVGSTLSRVLTGVGLIATVIGGVVIMSLMLIAVTERRREIGLRRAVGASQGDILRQFLVEAAVVAALGGLVGVVVGIGIAVGGSVRQGLAPALVWDVIGGAVLLSIAIGLVFGLQPAWRASRVDPIEALRS